MEHLGYIFNFLRRLGASFSDNFEIDFSLVSLLKTWLNIFCSFDNPCRKLNFLYLSLELNFSKEKFLFFMIISL